jgi:chromatin remodeling complex protein RSC6
MVRTTKSDKQSTPAQSAPVPAPVVEKSASSSKAAVKKPKKVKAVAETAPASTEVVAPVVVAAPVSAEAPLTNEVVDSAPVDTSSALVKINEFSAKLQQLISLFSTVKNDYKTLEKVVNREIKIAQKASSKKRRSNINRKPSGFIKPTRISDELAAFLGKTIGTEMARTEVSHEIHNYIHSNGLQDKANGRKINPDAKLAKLLKLNKEDELTYFNLQRYMKYHFIKAEVVDGVTSSA